MMEFISKRINFYIALPSPFNKLIAVMKEKCSRSATPDSRLPDDKRYVNHSNLQATRFYQLRLIWSGKIEIFQNVFKHHVRICNHALEAIDIKYSKLGNRGLALTETRSLEKIYDIQVIEKPTVRLTAIPQSNEMTILIN